MFSILCIHFFIAYQARTYKANLGAIEVNQRMFFILVNEISNDLGFE